MRLHLCVVGRMRNGPEKDLFDDYIDRFEKSGRGMGLGPVTVSEVEQQGNIRILIRLSGNGDNGNAGLSVSALGLRVANASDAADRAAALGTENIAPDAPGALPGIRAIRGFRGSIIHLIDHTTDLAAVPDLAFPQDTAAAGAGLTGVDHIGQTVENDELLTWALYYFSIFAMDKTHMFDVADPNGLVSSRGVESPDGTFRITLNGAGSNRTFAGHFLSDSYGASLQHIALSTDDIFETARILRQRGFETLPIPDNYFDDLAARTDLPEAEIARLRDAGILYDAEEGGTFLQLYGLTLGSGFFFEIVQRNDSYTGYGAANALYRIAAQKRLMPPVPDSTGLQR